MTRPTTSATGLAPMAAASARFWAAALAPTSRPVDQPVRKWRPSTRTSVLTAVRESGKDRTAQSSPVPTGVCGPRGRRGGDDGEQLLLTEVADSHVLARNPSAGCVLLSG